jgi:S1-C subfamily serine protease
MIRAAGDDHHNTVLDRCKLLERLLLGIVRRLKRPLIVRSVLVCLLTGPVVVLACVLRPPWPSVGANIAVESQDHGVRPSDHHRELIDPLEDQEHRLTEAIVRARESVVTLEYAAADGPSEARRVATGVVISDAGEVLSVRIDRPPSTVPVVARNVAGNRYPARWLASDAETGLTLLQIKAGVSRPIPTAVRGPQLGGQVLVIGSPFGLGHSVLRGHISGLDRRLELSSRQLSGLIQVAVALHPGDSGALVTNLRGEWLGLIRSGLALPASQRSRDREHDHDLGFAVPANDALWVADQLRSQGRVDRAYLGVRIDPGATVEAPGAALLGVLEGSPAGKAGLQTGDQIISLNGHAIESAGDLTACLDRTLAGTDVVLDVLRGTRTEHCIIHTTSRPAWASKAVAAPDPPAGADPNSTPTPAPLTSKADDFRPTIPRALIERLEQLEHRLEQLEKRPNRVP